MRQTGSSRGHEWPRVVWNSRRGDSQQHTPPGLLVGLPEDGEHPCCPLGGGETS